MYRHTSPKDTRQNLRNQKQDVHDRNVMLLHADTKDNLLVLNDLIIPDAVANL